MNLYDFIIAKKLSGGGGGGSDDTEYLKMLVGGSLAGNPPKKLVVPDGTTQVRERAFQSYYGFIDLVLPASISRIRDSAFYSATGVKSITLYATTPPTLGSNNSLNSVNIYVPSTAVDTYKAASGWSSYASKIQAIPE